MTCKVKDRLEGFMTAVGNVALMSPDTRITVLPRAGMPATRMLREIAASGPDHGPEVRGAGWAT